MAAIMHTYMLYKTIDCCQTVMMLYQRVRYIHLLTQAILVLVDDHCLILACYHQSVCRAASSCRKCVLFERLLILVYMDYSIVSQVCHTAQRGRCHILDVLVQSALCCLERRCFPCSSSPCPLLFTDVQCFHLACLSVHSHPVPILHLQAETLAHTNSLRQTLHLLSKAPPACSGSR